MKIETVAIVGLGYVGLPLAVALRKHFPVIGFDINAERIARLQKNEDASGEISAAELAATPLHFTTNPEELRQAQCIIICVPTPIDKHNNPDLYFMESSSKIVGKHLSPGTVVVYESTVYPGVTEDVCAPILEQESGLRCGPDFKIGYSPERINPGDKEHSIEKVVKIVAGMDQEALEVVHHVYGKITTTHQAPSIKVAEAAKVIENIQRDLNIALMNELALIFDKMGINVYDVLDAAGTKWNFHKYHPGLVGGHCIGVDPYYLTYKAEAMGHHPEVILAGRRINDGMHSFYVQKLLKRLRAINKSNPHVVLLGLTFKPNVSDYRNSRVKQLIQELKEYGVRVSAFDPYLSRTVVEKEFGAEYIDINNVILTSQADVIVLTVEHQRLWTEIKSGKLSSVTVVRLRDL